MKLVHVTDLHTVPPGDRLYGLDPAERLDTVIAAINRDHGDAEICVFTGDLADKGDAASYAQLRDCLQALAVPYRLLLGNHDNRAAFLEVFTDHSRDAHGFVQSFHDCAAGRLIFLDTLVEGHGYGALDQGRLDWLAACLEDASTTPAYIFTHHPLSPIGLPHFEPYGLNDSAAIMDRVLAAGTVRHVFFGHVHVDANGSWRGVPFSCNRGVAHQIEPNLSRSEAIFIAGAPTFSVALIDEHDVLINRFDASEPVVIGQWPPK
ncbi:Calcineurin-like phosphoesterase [Kaistia soli DSM 19436]|uniref:Calcineurin-like phosphoesterase n=1 Tax=Kaistia soli DSM 19436 TaxID=1122133 RepID=A0A1M4WER3_9HYPH|nr:phosphodiesterase [Kaistia soli]SHE79704.1 Calcineurin-like phosphoesterase [Kaistia soli DSM 19436]